MYTLVRVVLLSELLRYRHKIPKLKSKKDEINANLNQDLIGTRCTLKKLCIAKLVFKNEPYCAMYMCMCIHSNKVHIFKSISDAHRIETRRNLQKNIKTNEIHLHCSRWPRMPKSKQNESFFFVYQFYSDLFTVQENFTSWILQTILLCFYTFANGCYCLREFVIN